MLATTGAGSGGSPGAVLPRRPILVPVLVMAACTLGLGLWLSGHPLREIRFHLAEAGALTNLISAVAAFVRARESPAEATGWRLLGWALAVLTAASLGAGFLVQDPGSALRTAGPVVLGATSQGLATAALLCLPWKPAGLPWKARNLLASCLFVGSILLILWTLGDWRAGFRSNSLINLAMVAACGRLTLLGGVSLMLLEQDPRRIRGVLGFILVNVLLGGVYISLLQNLLVHGWLPAPQLASVYAVSPLILGLAAWSRAPLDFSDAPMGKARIWVFLPYAAFALAAVAILMQYLLSGRVAGGSLVGFILLAWLLLFRQFLLLQEMRVANQCLEERVDARTRDLEAMQSVVLRTERLNTLASLGAGIAHDLNNFLGVIRSSVQLIQQELDGSPQPGDRHLARIHASTDRAASLTGRLLGYARKDSEPPRRLDLAEALAQQEDLLRMLLPRNIELRMVLAPGRFPVLTRKSNLEQILVNLVCNAKDAMPHGGVVSIRLGSVPGPEGPLVQLEVADNGPGLPPEVLDHLFEFFVTTKGEGEGTGLGLATVKALVDGDHGTVRVDSSPQRGCRFILCYPPG
ncbi:MAG: ATP-binding protein [Holophaga sp.]|nr:ATP-binding protein [Holophaga sp.]